LAGTQYVVSAQPTDYEKNIDSFATEGYDIILTIGFMMGDATAAKASNTRTSSSLLWTTRTSPPKDSKACPDTVKDCYADGGLKNVTRLMFQEDQVGFFAGVVAAGMTKSGTVVHGLCVQIPPVERYVVGLPERRQMDEVGY